MSELAIPTLGYGAASVGNLYRAIDDDGAREILDAAWDAGIRYFDSAPHYGLGLSERRLGAMLCERPREEFLISTKVGRILVPDPDGANRRDNDLFEVPADHRRVWDFSVAGVRRSLEQSLERLGLDRVDILYLHDPEAADRPMEQAVDSGLAALAQLREEGLVTAIGVGTQDLDAVERAVRTQAIDLLMLAGRYTLLDAPARERVLPLCEERDVGVVSAAVFGSGLLAQVEPGPDSHYAYGPVPADKLAQARALAARCREFEVELPAAALQYGLQNSAVRSVVVGADTPDQVRQNVAHMAAPIPAELWTALTSEGLAPR